MELACEHCKAKFSLAESDLELCRQMNVDPPPLCMKCGIQRLESLRNERTLYRRACEKCGTMTISLYHPAAPYTVYCHDCWASDAWDAGDHAKDYDPQKPLLGQFKALQKEVPREALIILNVKNSSYGNNMRDSKDCYFCFQIANCEGLMYCWWVVGTKDSANSNRVIDSQLLETCIDCYKCYRGSFLQDCQDSSDCFFSYDLRGCTNCILCSNLRGKSYCIENVQYSKEDYAKKAKEVLDGSYAMFQINKEKFELLRLKAIHRATLNYRSANVTGNYIEASRNAVMAFDAVSVENVTNVASILTSKNVLYGYGIGVAPSEFIVDTCVLKSGGNDIAHCFNLASSASCRYSDSLITCTECIACVGLKRKEYCILNKQYSKEEYFTLKKELISKGEITKWMPADLSTFAYNETAAHDQFPLSKKEAIEQGFTWQDDSGAVTTGQETLEPERIPDNIKDVSDGILKETLRCVECSRNYRIIEPELGLYRRLNVPIPRTCPQDRIEWCRVQRLPFTLWHRRCMCTKDHPEHTGACPNEFETSYAPTRPDVVYCESCYNSEVI